MNEMLENGLDFTSSTIVVNNYIRKQTCVTCGIKFWVSKRSGHVECAICVKKPFWPDII